MQEIFTKEFDIRANDCDCYGNILPAALLDIFQSVAGEHANKLGCGFTGLLEKNLLWVLVKVKYKVIASPEQYQRVKVSTWPLAPGRVTLQREYAMTDMNDNPLIVGSSEWVTVDKASRRLSPCKDVYNINDTDFCSLKNFEGKFTRTPAFSLSEADESAEINPGYCDIDLNGHVNNTKYANFILNAFPPKKGNQIKEFQIDYHREIMRDDKIYLYKSENDNQISVIGCNENKEVMFSSKIEY